MKIRKKHIVRGILLFFLVTLTPLYELLVGPPKRITISGTIPEGYSVNGVQGFQTRSWNPLCRTYSLGMGRLLRTGKRTEHADAVIDEDGRYRLELPLEKKSFWCDWRAFGGVTMYCTVENKSDKKKSYKFPLVTLLRPDKIQIENTINLECAHTYYYTGPEDNLTKSDASLCRSKNTNFEVRNIWNPTLIRINSSIEELEMNISFVDGPQFYFSKGNKEKDFWQRFDALQQNENMGEP